MSASTDIPELAGRMPNIVRELQRTRMGLGPSQNVAGASDIASTAKAMFGTTPPNTEVNGKQNAPAAPGALQKDGSEESGRLANERQGKTQGRFGKGA
jgi:arylsulfatase A-like enzyme